MYLDVTQCPPVTRDFCTERRMVPNAMERMTRAVFARMACSWTARRFVAHVTAAEDGLDRLSDTDLRVLAVDVGGQIRRNGFRLDRVARSFSLIREVARRTLGMRHFDCQLLGGAALLSGSVAEMETGEGKTLTATLAAGTAALAGIPVHVITVNDYLSARDAEWMMPVYRALGLQVGIVIHGMDGETRRAAYDCDVTYCTNKEVAFDYLRDRLTMGDRTHPVYLQTQYLFGHTTKMQLPVMRGLHFAIVDEADSVLIDEARTPLIISGTSGGEDVSMLQAALDIAEALESGAHFEARTEMFEISMTDAGRSQCVAMGDRLGVVWRGARHLEESVRKALSALHLYRCDEHYLVRDGRVEIVDEFTGRIMADRSWERGLHQLVELKEGCEPTPQRETLGRMSYQRFFRRYTHLSGMTGTAKEARGEFRAVYGLSVVRVPTHRVLRREKLPDRVFETVAEKWQAVVDRMLALHKKGCPVLVGTRSVAASEHLSVLLKQAGLRHQVLNAKFDQHEAEIIARAGESGRITIATNMAGRGTDIRLGRKTRQLGLHVILTERHEAGRIDRQLAGRCGRQGDPGCYETFVSMEDPLVQDQTRSWGYQWACYTLGTRTKFGQWAGSCFIRKAQRKIERAHAHIRHDLLKMDEQQNELLAFSGRSE